MSSFIFVGASIYVENLIWYLQELVEITHYVEFLFYFIYVLADFHFHICSLVWMYAFMYLLWLFCLREVLYVYHNSVMSLALWICRMRKNCLITTVALCTWSHVLCEKRIITTLHYQNIKNSSKRLWHKIQVFFSLLSG